MAKFKPAGSRKKPSSAASNAKAIPCLIVILGIIVLILLLFYAILKSGT